MKVEENVYLCRLFDAYGKLLSKRQQEIMEAYLNDDFTLSEIAQNLNVSRQAVNDTIQKAEDKLKKFENNLSFLKRVDVLNNEISSLKEKLKDK